MKKLLSALFCLTLVLGITIGLASCGKVEFKVDFVVDGEIYASVNTSGKEIIKIPNDPVKEGYVFDGWYWDKDVWNKPFTANSLLDAPLSENMSVYAKWTSSESVQGVEAEFDGFTKIADTEYSITVPNSTEAFSLGTKVTVNSKSSWTLTSDIYGNTTISSKVAPLEVGDNVYYALVTAENGQSEMYKLNIRRRPMYMVTFDTDGGTTAEAVTIEEGSLVAAPDTYKKGYTLSGWSYDFTTPITKNETISAIWLANEYVITYDANGGTVAHEETGVVYDVNYTLEIPTRTGYSFDGWYLGNDLFEDGIWKGDSDITVVAKWSLINYEIEYDFDGGKLATANPETYNFVSESIMLTNPEKTGYTFLGWTGTDVSEPTLALEIASGSVGNRSYVANWVANTYTVTFNANGGNENYENVTATYDANITLPAPTKTGYSFAGWYEDTTPYTSGTWKTTKNVNLIAKWDAVSYDIGYTLNGGIVDGTNPTTYNVESEFTLINPTKTGYTFLGWTYEGVTEPVLNVSINDSIGALSFTANWKADSFKIYLDTKGGTVDKTEIPIDYDAEIILPTPEYAGHAFTGWSDGTNFVTGGKYNLTTDMNLVAVWDLDLYEIGYNLNGGTVDGKNPTTYTIESEFALINPTKTGHTFLGWTYEGVTEPTLNVTIANRTGNLNFVANFKVNEYALSFNSDGGASVADVKIEYGAEFTLPETTKTGYTFAGWYVGKDPFTAGNWTYTENKTVTAKWTAITYNINYTLGGGIVDGTNPTTYNVESKFTLVNPTKTGYTFLGWTYGSVTEPAINVTISASTGDLAFVAHWKADSFKIYLDTKGGTVDKTEIPIDYDAEIILPTPEYVGHTFTGWSDGTSFVTGGKYNLITNMNLVAVWDLDLYEIGYNLNGGTVDGKNPTAYTIESEFTLINPTKTGYTFLGWTYEGVAEPILNVTISDRTENINFVAHWSVNNYKLSFVTNGGAIVDSMTIAYGADFTLPITSKTGYNFDGWFVGETPFTAGTWNYTNDVEVVADWSVLTYNITYDLDGGTVDGENPTAYTIESEFTLINPTKAGYSFLGWTYEGVTEPTLNVTISGRTENINFVANFKANTNTPYKVEYYFENSNKNGYDILNSETENLAGITDTTASITPKTFEHFKFNSSKSTTSGNIDGEGALVLKVYYDRNSYTVTTSAESTKGGSVTSGATKIYGNEITVTATVKAGYTWLGWYEGNALVSGDLAYTFMPTRNISLVAKWSANEDTFYTVEYYHQNIDNNDYSLIHSDILTGTTDTLATATINSYPHFTYYAAISNASENIDGEGDAVLKIYYMRSSYTVTTRAMNAKAGSVTSGSAYRYGKTITVTATTNPGYTFLGWYTGNILVCETESYKFTVENAVTLTAKWSANEDTKYTVEYYLENKNKTGYTKVDTTVLEGTTDTTANAVISEYEHFTFTNTNSVISGNIAGNGKLVLKVYYTRDVYTINSAVENEKAGTVTSGGNYAYENSVSLVASSNPGYTFIGWYEGDTKVCDTLTFTFDAEKNVTYTAKWSADEDTPYTVNFYKDNMTKAGYNSVLFNSITLLGTTDTLATFVVDELNGYLFNAEKSVLTGNINGDGTLVLNVYYTLDLYYREGEYIYFGEYPQSLKADYVTITTTVDNRGYYLGSDGYYYAKIVADPYSSSYKFESGESIVEGREYYFKIEPIKWRVIKEENGNAFLICDSVITSRRFDDSKWTDKYENSEIQLWLTKEFYKNSFDSLQKQIVQTSYHKDGIYLLSSGTLSTYASKCGTITTDYTKAMGMCLSYYWWSSTSSGYGTHGANFVNGVNQTGKIESFYPTTEYMGVVPAMWIAVNTCSISTATENPKAGFVSDGGNYEIGSEVKLVASSNPGYTFIGWYEGDTKVCDTLTFTFNAEKNVTYTAKWSANADTAYTVEYYLENVEKNGYDLLTSETEQLAGVTDTTATAALKQFNHFSVDNYKSMVSGNINGNGTLVLKIYYTRNSYTLASSNTLYGGITTTGTYVYGAEEEFAVSVANVKIGCSFLGWYSENELLSTDLEYVFTSEKNVVAKFDISPEMQNFVFSPSLASCNITGIKDNTVTEIIVPDYVTSISVGAFSGCSSVERMTIPFVGGSADATAWNATTLFGYIFGKTSYEGATATKQNYNGSSYVAYYIPTSLKSITITGGQLYRYAFENCKSITDVIMGNDVTGIGDYAFMGCSKLTNLVIGDGVLNIGNRAFYQCANLESATIGNGVKTIDDLAFSECSSLKTVTLPDSVTTIEACVFEDCTSLESVFIGDGLTSISYATFSGCTSLTTISIGKNVSNIALYAFSSCNNIRDVYITDLAKWCGGTFDHNGGNPLSSAKNLYINGELTVDLIIPDGVTTISSSAFLSFDSLVSVTIPNTVTTIGAYAFQGCKNIMTIKYSGTKEQWNKISEGYWCWDSDYTVIYDYKDELNN